MTSSLLHAGKIAFITGAGSGIGRSVAQILARDGARIIAADINKKGAEDTVQTLPNPGDHLSIQVDVSNSGSVKDAFKISLQHYSKPAMLLAQAAGITRDNFLHKLDEKQFMDVIDINLKGTFLVQQQFLKQLDDIEDKLGAAVVNFSSIVCRNGNMGQSNYAASKAGVEAFSKSTAKELGKKGVRVNVVQPGFCQTPLVDTVPEHLKNMIVMVTPLQRMGHPDEVAEVVSFLLSHKSSFMTGTVVEVSGGLSM